MSLPPPAPPARFRHPTDATVAVLVTVVVLIGTAVNQQRFGAGEVVAWMLGLAAGSALYLRRRHPIAISVFTLCLTAIYYPLLEPDGPIFLTFVVALYTAAAEGHLAIATAIGSAAAIAVAAAEAGSDVNHLADAALFLLFGWIVAVVAVGGLLRNRNAYLREAQRRADEAERILEEEARRRAVEERLRIARELHDALGHHLSLINVQAGAALHGFARDPVQAETALGAIKTTSREALAELRSTIGVLRQVDEAAPIAPAPSLTRLAELVAHARRTGLDVEVDTPDGIPPLPPSIDLAAYRIVQEALTNVTRHAHAERALVRVTVGDGRIGVDVEDDGRGGSVNPGNGITGMGERARALGGEFRAEARPEGGFRVSAHLPIGGGAA